MKAGWPLDYYLEPGKKRDSQINNPKGGFMFITIDGPAGSGKGSVAKLFAVQHNFFYLDCGLIYRACAFLYKKIGEGNFPGSTNKLSYLWNSETAIPKLLIDGTDIRSELIDKDIAEKTSLLSLHTWFTDSVKDLITKIVKGQEKGITDGRNTGSTLFPNADFKFFLTARLETRAKRRKEQLDSLGYPSDYEQVLEHLRQRDIRDTQRLNSPLCIPVGAMIINSEGRTQQECKTIIEKIVFAC